MTGELAALAIVVSSSLWALGMSLAARRAAHYPRTVGWAGHLWSGRWFFFPFIFADLVLLLAASTGEIDGRSFFTVLALWSAATIVAYLLAGTVRLVRR